MIYADNAATTKLDIEVFESMKPFLLEDYSNPSQPYMFSSDSKKAIRDSREMIASCIGAKANEIYFTSCGTESDNWAIKAVAGSGGQVITSVIEHHAVLNTCKHLEKEGHIINYISVDNTGIIDLEKLSHLINSKTKIVSIMLANNEIGSIQPISEICRVIKEYSCVLHTDAVQAVGHIDIDVEKLGVDMLSASAHKFNGPKGVGFLYIKDGTNIAPYMDGGSQEFGLRAGTENVASIVGMATALKNNCSHLEENKKMLLNLEEDLILGLKENHLDFIRNGSPNHIPGNISLSFKNVEGEMLLHRLDLMGICISTGSACDSKNTQVSHVIKAIGVPDGYAQGTIRISFGKSNTREDVKEIVKAITKVLV